MLQVVNRLGQPRLPHHIHSSCTSDNSNLIQAANQTFKLQFLSKLETFRFVVQIQNLMINITVQDAIQFTIQIHDNLIGYKLFPNISPWHLEYKQQTGIYWRYSMNTIHIGDVIKANNKTCAQRSVIWKPKKIWTNVKM